MLLQEARQLAVAEGLEGDAIQLLDMLQRMLPKAAIVAPEIASIPVYEPFLLEFDMCSLGAANHSERTAAACVVQ